MIYCYFVAFFAPKWIRLWAGFHGFRLLGDKMPGLIGLLRCPLSLGYSSQVIRFVTVEDQEGLTRSCWIRLGGFWPSLSLERCPAEIIWDGDREPSRPIQLRPAPDRPELWDRDLDS